MSDPVQAIYFSCPGCGAPDMVWSAATRKLECPYCRHQMDVPQPPTDPIGLGAHQERPLAEGYAMLEQHDGGGLGTEVRTTECQVCGATVAFAGVDLASRCDFCGSNQVVEQQSNRHSIRPQSVVPFAVEQAVASTKFRHWLAALWFRPNNLKRLAKVGDIHGVYVPYWTFDTNVSSRWTAESGTYYYVTESYSTVENGRRVQRTRQVRHVRWHPAHGNRADHYDDVLVVASRGLPTPLANKLKTFDTSQLLPYDPRYLAGWRAEEYAVALDEGWNTAAAEVRKQQYARCSRDVPGDTHRNLNVENQFSDETFKHVLMPIWIASYRYRDTPYRFLVNGQTGEVTGEAPWSWVKIMLATLLALALVVVLLYAVR